MRLLKTWIRRVAALGMTLAVAGCTQSAYRNSFNWSAPFEAYWQYEILPSHPFDTISPPPDQVALVATLDEALKAREFIPADRDERAIAQQMVLVFNHDIPAGRLRVQSIAASEARTWFFHIDKQREDDRLIALEVYERQSGDLIYRAEALRQQSVEETVAALLSNYPPKTQRFKAAQKRTVLR